MRDSPTSGNVDNSTNWSQIPNIIRVTIMSFNGLLGWKTLHHPPRRYPAIRPGLPQEGSGKSFNTRQCCQPGSPAEPDFQHCLGTHHRAPNYNYQVEKLPITLPTLPSHQAWPTTGGIREFLQHQTVLPTWLASRARFPTLSGNTPQGTKWQLPGWKTSHHSPRRYPAIRPGLPQEGSGKSFNTRQCCQPDSLEPDFQHYLKAYH